MGFVSVRPHNFRNLEDRRVDCDAQEVFLVGDNGQGKTNFIEAVHLLCYGSSFRTRIDRRLIRHGAEEAAVQGTLRRAGGADVDISVRLGGTKEILVNGKVVADRADLLGNIPCIVFSHEDFDFVGGPPERRRWFMNQTLSLCDLEYLQGMRAYRRVITSRNLVLRQGNLDLLEHYDQQLAVHGLEVQERRRSALRGFSAVFSDLFGRVSGLTKGVTLAYLPSWKSVADVPSAVAALRAARELDLRFGSTTHGPHRDSYVFRCEGSDFAHVASTGQLRLCSLVLRVAQAHYLLERTGKRPILLLDDVILELDGARKRAFVENLPQREQAFFTFLSDEEHAAYRHPGSLSYTVKEGRIEA